MSCTEILAAILRRSELDKPDGRPLYAYRLAGSEREAIRKTLGRAVLDGPVTTAAAMAFCLLAADELARCTPEEVGAWSPVTRALGVDGYPQLYPWVRAGLRAWRREVLIHADHQRYLVTLVCEGGLPLSVLQNEDARLTRYLRVLLLEHERFPSLELGLLAKQYLRNLPSTLQNPVVSDLAAKLTRAVAELRADFPNLDDRVAALSGPRAGDIPVNLDENTGRLLLEGLLRAPAVVDQATGALPELQTILRLNGAPSLRRQVRLPFRVNAAVLADALGCKADDLRGRMILRIELADGSRHAVAAVSRSREQQHELELDAYRPMDIEEQHLVRGPASFVLDDGMQLIGRMAARGGAVLPDDLPWVFVQIADTDDARLVATGSARVVASQLYVSVPEGTALAAVSGSVGSFAPLDGRPTFRLVEGEATWTSEESTVRLRTGNPHEDADELHLSGKLHSWPGVLTTIWSGMPRVTRSDRTTLSDSQTHVRHRGTLDWVERTDRSWGDLKLRVVQDGVLVLGAQLLVLPVGLTLTLEGIGPSSGVIHISGYLGIHAVGVTPSPGVQVRVQREGSEHAVCVETSGPPPATIELWIAGDRNERVALEVEYPRHESGFLLRGQPLQNDARIALAELPYARARVVEPGGSKRWELDVLLENGAQRLAQLSVPSHGRSEFHMAQVQEVLDLALRSSDALNHELRLTLVPQGAGKGTRLYVRRYETGLVPLENKTQVSIPEGERLRTGATTLANLRADGVPVFDPQGRRPLSEAQAGTWDLPDALTDSGPWIVLVWEGNHLRCRPLLCTRGTPPAVDNQLADAMTTLDKRERQERIRGVIQAIAKTPGTKEWTLIRAFLRLLPDVPPSAFDVLTQLATLPEAAALAAFSSGRDAPRHVLTGLEQLPFMWEAVPIRAWINAAQSLDKYLADPGLFASFVPWLLQPPADRPWLNVLHEILTAEIPGIGEPRSPIVRMATTADGRGELLNFAREHLQELRQSAGESAWWPTQPLDQLLLLEPWLHELEPSPTDLWSQMPQYVQDLARLPWLLAAAAVSGPVRPSAGDILAIRRARHFNPRWFDETYAFALASVAGWHKEKKKEPFADE